MALRSLEMPASLPIDDSQALRPGTPCAKLGWLIIGGGIHGVHIAARLLADAGVASEALRIIDPGERLLSRWRACTETTGMSHLRSPSAHHLDVTRGSLDRFAGDGGLPRHKTRAARRRLRKLFAPPFHRPALDLFNAHCDAVIAAFGLADLHVRARVVSCAVDCEGVRVELSTGEVVAAQNIVLALGAGDEPAWPEWAPRADPRIHHVFDPDFAGWPTAEETVVVIGGGITAGQVALRLSHEGHCVHLVSRHPLRRHPFDSDPHWKGPEVMAAFLGEPDLARRRAMICEARRPGSVPPSLWRALRRAIARGDVDWRRREVRGLDVRDGLRLQLSDGEILEPDRVLLATGFASRRPGGRMVDRLIESASLPCASCGFPVVDAALRWHPRVYVSGPLAELELGPVSPNILGARRAADRLVAAVLSSGAGESPGPRPSR